MKETQNPYSKLHYVIELTEKCNNRCHYCYNVWKLDRTEKSSGDLTTEQWKFLIDKLHRETGCTHISISGGEPTIREDFMEILSHIHSFQIESILITNGSNLSREFIIKCMERGVRTFELPLLGPTRELHNEIAGNDCWDKIIEGIVDIRSSGGRPVVVFVATNKNLPYFEETLKLAIALETDCMMLNRFNPGGEGLRHIEELLPDVPSFEKAMEIANRYAREYRYAIASSIPVQPCLINLTLYPYVRVGFCVAGTENGYFTIGPDGKIRPCNHSVSILGDFFKETFEEIIKKPLVEKFRVAVPEICKVCSLSVICQGGCKAAAEVCSGSPGDLDPFLKKNFHLHPAYLKDHPAHSMREKLKAMEEQQCHGR